LYKKLPAYSPKARDYQDILHPQNYDCNKGLNDLIGRLVEVYQRGKNTTSNVIQVLGFWSVRERYKDASFGKP
jgi:hypothetical protein